jgi:hypothetical protein
MCKYSSQILCMVPVRTDKSCGYIIRHYAIFVFLTRRTGGLRNRLTRLNLREHDDDEDDDDDDDMQTTFF